MIAKYHSITDVSQVIKEDCSTIRYWEDFFGKPKPQRDNAGRRQYTESDIEILKLIKKLVREEGLHLEKAKIKLEILLSMKGQRQLPVLTDRYKYTLLWIREELKNILRTLKEKNYIS